MCSYFLTLAWEGRYCDEDVDGCAEAACFEGVTCTDVPAPGTGAICGQCPTGYTGDGSKVFRYVPIVKCPEVSICIIISVLK